MNAKPISTDLMYEILVQRARDYSITLVDETGIVLDWNAGAERAKGYAAEEIVGQSYECFYSERDRDRGVPRRDLEKARRDGHFATEGWRYRKDGSCFWGSVVIDAVHDADAHCLGLTVITRDLTAERDATLRFELQSRHDSLTGLLNRDAIAARLESELWQVVYGNRIALHYVDLDRFKPVNDTFGHQMGDVVLREIAGRLRDVAGDRAIVGRLGGDEFVVLQLASPTHPQIAELAAAIVNSLNQPVEIGQNRTVNVGASVGVAIAPTDGSDVAALFASADLALYRAKSDGRNRVRFFDTTMREQALARRVLELKLRHAVEAEDFTLAYQPVVDSQDGRTTGYEALLRWVDQTGTAVSPATFIPIAEELGLMPDLGAWVLQTACRDAASWPADLVVAVNLSATQLKQPDLSALVAQILEDTGLPAHRLELEITETAVLDDLPAVRSMLLDLRELGVGIALDDFGTGFSSLSLVRALPLTRIKIDRSFVADIDSLNRSSAVVESVVALCRGFGLSITAEGVENEHQRDGLRASGCHELQGFFFGRPASLDEWAIGEDPVPVACAG